MYRADVSFAAGERASDVLLKTLVPEVGKEIPRTSAKIESHGGAFRLRVEAEDLSSLRAAMNSYLRWIQVSIDTMGEVRIADGGN